eukprot:CAMPEP_0198301130 /NCGR_PEP_ID=MMETSP1449-20131203/50718_1 /TAXON_ID=420275 /ORGANISM="Attheya septentrionalis, Strain CCMP2084" /LENGTH=64 /DNA_ID=CAMNT_0044003135 /DNA_START=155 /DNA_END=346 /DNA_ORIENTATION=-
MTLLIALAVISSVIGNTLAVTEETIPVRRYRNLPATANENPVQETYIDDFRELRHMYRSTLKEN